MDSCRKTVGSTFDWTFVRVFVSSYYAVVLEIALVPGIVAVKT